MKYINAHMVKLVDTKDLKSIVFYFKVIKLTHLKKSLSCSS